MIRMAAAVLALAALGAAPRPASAQSTLTCQSSHGRREFCRADTRGGVRLVQRLSDAACVRGRSWGVTRNAIWVDDGCRARFRVGDRYGSGGYNDGWGYDDGRGNHDGRGRDGRGDGRTERGGARMCQEAVANRLRVSRSRIETWVTDARDDGRWDRGDRNRERVYGWSGAGRRGTCRLDRDGDLTVRFNR